MTTPELVKSLTFTLDCRGELVGDWHLWYIENLVSLVHGSEQGFNSFWITRTELWNEWKHRQMSKQVISPARDRISSERFHDESFDLYLQGELEPIGRLVNVGRMPESEWR